MDRQPLELSESINAKLTCRVCTASIKLHSGAVLYDLRTNCCQETTQVSFADRTDFDQQNSAAKIIDQVRHLEADSIFQRVVKGEPQRRTFVTNEFHAAFNHQYVRTVADKAGTQF